MKKTVLLVCLLLTGCVEMRQDSVIPPYNLVMAENDCAAVGAPFELLSGCIQTKLQERAPEWVIGPDADLLRIYFGWLASAGEQVSHGTLLESDARIQARQLKDRLRAIHAQRDTVARQQALNNALVGLALIQASIPQVAPLPVPAPPVQCTTYRTNPVTGQTQTVCN